MSNNQLSEFRKDALRAHNEKRARHGAPALKLSDDLNKYAQNWAEKLAAANQLEHSPCKLNGETLGENVATKWASNGSEMSGDDVTDMWYSEIKKHNFAYEQNSGTGHFTQLVWKSTTEFGIGKAKAKGFSGGVYVVGSYRPAGNMFGEYLQNVQPPKQ